MSGPDIPRLAWRNLWRNRRRTVLTLIAITFGLFLAILMTALQDRSFADMIDTAARMRGGHVSVQHPSQQDAPSLSHTLPDARGLASRLVEVDGAEHAVVRISGPAMLATAGQSYGAYFIAIDPTAESEETLAYLDGSVEGRMLESADEDGIVLGRKLAANLRVTLGKKVVVTMMDREGEITSDLFRVRGLLSTGSESTDRAIALLPLERVQRTLQYAPTEATEIALFADDPRGAPALKAAIGPLLPEAAVAMTWDEVQAELRGFIAMKVGGARFMEAIIILLVAASIFNTLLVSVMERAREFGIMIAIGWSPGQLFRLVMWESTWLALTGVLAGGLLTAGPYYYLSANPIDLSAAMAAQGQDSLDIGGVGMSAELAIGIFPENLAIIVTIIVGATLLSGIYPAWRAGRTVPVETIKLV
jgi:ABC-type lipoprotein release transport system permease subunit